MDAFYASVEQRDRPELRGRPVIVGADPSGRGVVSAASYEARRFGVHSAMPIGRAARLCPDGAFLPVDMDKYAVVSHEVMAILADFTPLLEPVSIDEAFLDHGHRAALREPPEAVRQIKERIRRETGLTASAGLAPGKFLARSPRPREARRPSSAGGRRLRHRSRWSVSGAWGASPRALRDIGIATVGRLQPPRSLVRRR
jgi:DNA polymerase-4